MLIKQKSREERWFDPGHIEAGGKWVPAQLLLLIRTALGYAPVVVAGGCLSGGGGGRLLRGWLGILALHEDSGKPVVLPLQMALPTVRESQVSSRQTQTWFFQAHPPLCFSMPWTQG